MTPTIRRTARWVVALLLVGVITTVWYRTQIPGYHGPCFQNVAIDVASGVPDYTGVAAWTRGDGTGDQYYGSDCSDDSRAAP